MCLKIVGRYKKYYLSIYKMVDVMDVYKSLNIIIVTVIKNVEILKLVPDHFKTKK